MTATFASSSRNTYIAALESVFDQSTSPIEWLAIAHNDSRLLNALSKALIGKPAVVLHVARDNWDFAQQELAKAIEWSLQRADVTNLIIAGSSYAAAAVIRASLVPNKPAIETEDSFGKLLVGVNRHNTQNGEVQNFFARQVEQISQIPLVRSRCLDRKLAVDGLFYRAESGMFCKYDKDMRRFRLLR